MNHIIHPNVVLGHDCSLGHYIIIGEPPRGRKAGDLETIIGDNAVIRSHTVIYAGNMIGRNLQTGHGVMIREENIIGDDISIGTNSVIEHHVTIKNFVRIHCNAFIPEYSVLEAGAWIGPNVVLTNAKYPLSPGVKEDLKGPVIGKGAIIGANVTILPGVKIGAKVLVGAGALVNKDIPEGAVVVGNPARMIADISELPY